MGVVLEVEGGGYSYRGSSGYEGRRRDGTGSCRGNYWKSVGAAIRAAVGAEVGAAVSAREGTKLAAVMGALIGIEAIAVGAAVDATLGAVGTMVGM